MCPTNDLKKPFCSINRLAFILFAILWKFHDPFLIICNFNLKFNFESINKVCFCSKDSILTCLQTFPSICLELHFSIKLLCHVKEELLYSYVTTTFSPLRRFPRSIHFNSNFKISISTLSACQIDLEWSYQVKCGR